MSKAWLSNKRLVIIGGTAGMGLSAALACIEEGAKVVVIGKNPEHSEEAQKQTKNNGIVITGDATQETIAAQAIETCAEKFSGFDGLYHVAGGSGRKFGDGPLHEMTTEGWEKTLQLNLTSLMLSNRAAIKYFMEKKQGGAILNMGSVLGFSPSPIYFSTHAYAATKSAVIGFTKALAAYYAPYNIRVNVIAPSLIETPMSQRAVHDETIIQFIKTKQPLDGGRIGIPEDANGAAVFLLSDHSKFITGQVIAVDGGWCVSEGQY
ncbi:MAG TPA: SDR family NAD(P)-dependent oxidoreductase [Chitinophagaceae bacterium]|nr:SDR family NAD(P)-dependent oxidoreductase [Chitinophagaceae bacterium]